jgi:hypothetical protein
MEETGLAMTVAEKKITLTQGASHYPTLLFYCLDLGG